MKNKSKKIKAWAVVNKQGKIMMENFFTKDFMKRKATLAIFPYQRITSYSPLWGYALEYKGEDIVAVEIRILPRTKKVKKSINK